MNILTYWLFYLCVPRRLGWNQSYVKYMKVKETKDQRETVEIKFPRKPNKFQLTFFDVRMIGGQGYQSVP